MKQKIVLIGASTGGPGHLKKILSALPPTYNAALVIAQHMNSVFIPSFISQFKNELSLGVSSIDACLELKSSMAYFCPYNCILSKHNFTLCVEPSVHDITPYNPSVNTLFTSALPFIRDIEILAVLLTGIGDDGAFALSALKQEGVTCIAESEKSAIVYGMPKRALEINPLISSMPLDDIILHIKKFGE